MTTNNAHLGPSIHLGPSDPQSNIVHFTAILHAPLLSDPPVNGLTISIGIVTNSSNTYSYALTPSLITDGWNVRRCRRINGQVPILREPVEESRVLQRCSLVHPAFACSVDSVKKTQSLIVGSSQGTSFTYWSNDSIQDFKEETIARIRFAIFCEGNGAVPTMNVPSSCLESTTIKLNQPGPVSVIKTDHPELLYGWQKTNTAPSGSKLHLCDLEVKFFKWRADGNLRLIYKDGDSVVTWLFLFKFLVLCMVSAMLCIRFRFLPWIVMHFLLQFLFLGGRYWRYGAVIAVLVGLWGFELMKIMHSRSQVQARWTPLWAPRQCVRSCLPPQPLT